MALRRRADRLVLTSVLLLLAWVATACISPEVTTESSATLDVRDLETFDWLPIEIVDDALEADGPLADKLSERGRSGVVARGYRAMPDETGGGSMTLQLSVSSALVSKRTVSPDPDTNHPVNRTFEEAVLRLVSIDRESGDVLWRGRARGLMPEREGVIGRNRETIWLETLDALVGSLPRR
jgi:hypothetical protein